MAVFSSESDQVVTVMRR